MKESLGVTEDRAWQLAHQVMTDEEFLVFWLKHGEDFTSVQIGQLLKISRQAVDRRLKKGTERLRNAIMEVAA